MAVSSILDFAGPFTPDGVATSFPFGFAALSADEVTPLRMAADGTVTELSGFSVDLNDDYTGTINFTLAPLAGDPIYIVSEPSFEQQADFANQQSFSGIALTKALDRGAIRDIALLAAVSRAPLAPPTETMGELPSAAARAGKFFGFGPDGDPVALSGTGNDSALRTDLAAGTGAALIGVPGGGTVQDGIATKGPATAVVGSVMAIDKILGDGVAVPSDAGAYWIDKTYAGTVRAKRFTLANTPSGGIESIAAAGFDYAEASGSTRDVVAHLAIARARANNSVVFGGNDIVVGDAGLTGVRYVIREGDIQPAAGTTPANGCIGYAWNAFSVAIPGNTTQINGVFGGSWANGHVVYGPIGSTGAALAGGAGGSAGSLTHTGACTYSSGAAHIISNLHKERFLGTGSVHWEQWCDASNNFKIKFGSASFVWRKSDDSANLVAIDTNGTLAVGQNATIADGYKLSVAADVSVEGSGIAGFRNSAGSITSEVLIATGTNGNAAACAHRVRANSVTSRSINAGGTVNASGADYAEYERKIDGVSFAKGDVVGFNADGLLTDRFADAIRFGIKSTKPNLVGGDDWAADIPAAPVPPLFVPPEYTGIADPGPTPKISEANEDEMAARAAFAVAKQSGDESAIAAAADEVGRLRGERSQRDGQLWTQWETDHTQRQIDVGVHEAAVEQARAEWEATVWHSFEIDLAEHNELLDQARQPVDRIAYCGKVPLNLTGATPGQWVIVSASGSGGIEPLALDYAATTQEQRDRFCIGTVNRILDDGRAEIVVRV
jgi:hypothetical protein